MNDLDPKGLLPCPFCGGAAKLHGPHADLGAWVSCATCGLEGPTETGQTEADATNHWNRRHLSAVPDGEGELVEGEASEAVKAILDVHSHLMRHTNEPYFISSRDSYQLMGPLLRSAVKLEKLEREAASRLSQAGVRDERVKAIEEAILGLNVTDQELVRIHNSCTGIDGDVKIWSKMLLMLVANIIAVRSALSGDTL